MSRFDPDHTALQLNNALHLMSTETIGDTSRVIDMLTHTPHDRLIDLAGIAITACRKACQWVSQLTGTPEQDVINTLNSIVTNSIPDD